MVVDNKTIIITDPCYLVSDDNSWIDFINEKISWEDIFQDWKGDYEISDTGVGDGEWSIKDLNTGEILGTYTADAGMIGIFLEEDILHNAKDSLEKLSKKCYCRIPNFTGSCYIDYISEDIDSNEQGAYGNGNVEFVSI